MTTEDKNPPEKVTVKPSSVKKEPTAANSNKDNKKKTTGPTQPNWALRVLTVLLIFLTGAAASIYFMPSIKERLPFVANWIGEADNAELATLTQRVDAQQLQINTLTQQSTSLRNQLANVSTSPATGSDIDIAAIEARITSLEEISQSGPELAEEQTPAVDTSQSARIDMLLSRMSQLEASFVPLSKNMVDAAQAEKERQSLQAENTTLSTKITDIESRLATVENIAAKDNAGLMINLKVAELKRKLISGQAYNQELEQLQNLIANSAHATNEKINAAIAHLSQNAMAGIETPSQLSNRFNELIPSLIASANIDEGGSWWQTTLNRLQNMITVRRTDNMSALEEGVDGMIAQIERWLQSEDLRSILAILETIPGAVQEMLQDWKADIENWLESQDAINDLETTVADVYLVNTPDQAMNIPEAQI